MSIAFIYRIGNSKNVYYGKYVSEGISDDHDGLDLEIKPFLIAGLKKYRKKKNLSEKKLKVSIGILSFSEYSYTSKQEIKCFDFYYREYGCDYETYVNGKLV